MYTAEDILEAREKRIEFLERITEKYGKTTVTLRVNYPGIEKDNSITRKICEIVDNVINTFFKDKIEYKLKTTSAEGPICIYAIDESPLGVKDMTMEIEDKHTLGRCVDIDVYDENGKSLSRLAFGAGPRKCFICDQVAHECVRNRNHTSEEIIKYIADRYSDYCSNIELL